MKRELFCDNLSRGKVPSLPGLASVEKRSVWINCNIPIVDFYGRFFFWKANYFCFCPLPPPFDLIWFE